MTAYLLINHLLNFIAPAGLMALLLMLCTRYFGNFFNATNPLAPAWPVQLAVNFGVGVGVLLAGLVLLGRDGKMVTYLLLMLATATSQWWQLDQWRPAGKK
ncbi:MAG: hypothetical protein M3R45_00500 [Pseudomonadota bacterium]|nr:hypothetical protein [Pseudomonadota bacterium]